MVEIRKIAENDIKVLQEIGKQTFFETFTSENSEENMIEYLENEFSTEKLRSELRNKSSLFYFAESDGKVVGYLKINLGDAQTEINDINSLEIERIYVLKEFFRKGVGQKLLDMAIKKTKELKKDYVWLGVWEHNTRAIRFYEKNGFFAFDKHIFRLGEDEQTDIMMRFNPVHKL
ncbi:GNAT family N-acetyltransferase [Saccharicrinis sp. 156]|uniref:GNAT family N-acetyltransferase n=1 Tax=Saccharicrinis sp. 156 TaxID=3417574 RepID=UPI003D32BF46